MSMIVQVRRLLVVLLLASSGAAQGAISLSGTRLIFDGRYHEASIEVR
ncbi:molecular chaperone, partial [Pseudomonas syringae pv. actinidifoliorum]|nr:molecular chaperone [Pseudomonas syringae pv. actinidifoliorum]